MQASKNTPSRKKFLIWGAAVLSSITILKFLTVKKKKNTDIVKMLTQDGRLVEIERASLIGTKRRNITDDELKNWVKK